MYTCVVVRRGRSDRMRYCGLNPRWRLDNRNPVPSNSPPSKAAQRATKTISGDQLIPDIIICCAAELWWWVLGLKCSNQCKEVTRKIIADMLGFPTPQFNPVGSYRASFTVFVANDTSKFLRISYFVKNYTVGQDFTVFIPTKQPKIIINLQQKYLTVFRAILKSVQFCR